MNKRMLVAIIVTGFVIAENVVSAQDSTPRPIAASSQSAPDDLKLLRQDVRSLKKQIVAANIELTDTEAQQFWPVYDQYTAEMTKIMDKKFEVIEEYVTNYTTITNEQADAYIKGRATVEESVLRLRLKYIPLFRKVVSGRTAALFFQMDWRLSLVIDLQLSAQVPMIEP